MHGLAFDSSTGSLFGTYGTSGGDGLYRISTSTGAASFLGHIGFTVLGLAIQPGTNVLYGAVSGPGRGAFLTIDTATGAGTLVAKTQKITGLAFHPFTGVLYGVRNQGTVGLYTIDLTTAETTFVGNTGLSNNLGLEFAGYFVPEPPGLTLLAVAGFFNLAARSRYTR